MSRIAIVLVSALIAAITLSVIVIVLRSASERAEAGTPGVDFAIGIDLNGDGTNDCGSGVPRAVGDGAPDVVAAEVTNTTCDAAPGSTLEVRVYLMDNAGVVYYGVGTQIHYSGVNSGGPGRDVWTTLCAYPAVVKPPTPGIKNTGCAANEPRTDVGLMSVFLFVCTASGTLSLDNGPGETALTDNYLVEHRDPGSDELTVNCRAPTPTPTPCPVGTCGLDFAVGIDVDGDGTNDCGTGVPRAVGNGAPDAVAVEVTNTTCNGVLGGTLAVSVYLIDNDGVAYAGQTSWVYFTGITSNGQGTSVWTGCVFALGEPPDPAYAVVSCAIGVAPAVPLTNLGLMNKFSFTCTDSGTIRLGNAGGETSLTDDALADFRDAGLDELKVSCGTVPLPGDSNCDGVLNSVDATLILQLHAGLIGMLPCDAEGDVNRDGRIDSLDALLILQFSADFIQQL